MARRCLFSFVLLAGLGFAGEGVTPPRVVPKLDPRYTREARRAMVQGTVLLEVVVDELGAPARISVLSPLGFGLDERAVEAVSQWQFQPGRKDGQAVETATTVSVDFRLFHRWFDAKPEEHRTSYNLAVDAIQSNHVPLREAARTGDGFPPDRELALRLIVEAANRSHPAAMFETGRMMMEGTRLAPDAGKGLELVRNAAVLGHRRAQFYLGSAYEQGAGVARDPEESRRYYRLCAALGETECQIRLAKLQLDSADRQERDLVQAVAWLDLAAERGSLDARMMLDELRPALTPKQIGWAGKFKAQFSQGR